MDMIFGEGPILSGNWYNPKTGDSFTVRDTYFEDNNFYVITTDGRRMDYNLMSQYLQSDKPIPKMEELTPQTQQIPQEVLSQMESNGADDLMTDEDRALIMMAKGELQGSQVNIQQPTNIHPKPIVTQGQGEDEDSMLIRRILKRATLPSVDCRITWKNFPLKQFDMLDMMAVDIDKIADYYLSNINLEEIREIVKKGILEYIDKQLTPQEVKVVIPEEKPTKEKPTSKPNNKTKEKKKK